ncbi:MAG: hypothetical protein J07HQX50_00430 [Haloquadratum sp. J07HQX50]|jgi:hypothetical protein|nr:MAG: hypothetical protein J07HQX50_00430 [Haloquadratum sp. J07HQX50]
MGKQADSNQSVESSNVPAQLGEARRLGDVESYEIEDGIVFYDPDNPLAWVETSHIIELSEYC